MRVNIQLLREAVHVALLMEGRVEQAREKYPDIEESVFQSLVDNQPAGSNNKYLMWSAKQVSEGFGVDVVITAVRSFNAVFNRLEKKDINQYPEVGDVEAAVQAVGTSKSAQQKQIAKDADTVYRDDRFIVVRPNTAEASCKYGSGTKWCISASASHNYFSSYSTGNNRFYFVIDTATPASHPMSKVAVAFVPMGRSTPVELYDAADHRIELPKLATHVGESWDKIWAAIQKHEADNPDTWEVKREKVELAEIEGKITSGREAEIPKQTLVRWISITNNLSDAVINALMASPRVYIRRQLAQKTTLTQDQYKKLAKDPDPDVARVAFRKVMLSDEEIIPTIQTANMSALGELLNRTLSPAALNQVAKRLGNKSIYDKKDTWAPQSLINSLFKQSAPIEVEDYAQIARAFPRAYYILVKELAREGSAYTHLLPLLMVGMDDKPTEVWREILDNDDTLPQPLVVAALKSTVKFGKSLDRYKALRGANVGTDVLAALWNELSPTDRASLLTNPKVPATVLAKFSASGNSAYKFSVAHNPSTPLEILDQLMNDASSSTRAAVAANPKATPEMLTTLSRDEAWMTRLNVASNRHTPSAIVRELIGDSNPQVQTAAQLAFKVRKKNEAIVRNVFALLREAWDDESDDEMPDMMSPRWDEIEKGTVTVPEFVTIYMLQNGGGALSDDVEKAVVKYRGNVGNLWGSSPHENADNLRGVTANSRAWWWAPLGSRGKTYFKLTPSGAAGAFAALNRLRTAEPKKTVGITRVKKNTQYTVMKTQSSVVIPELLAARVANSNETIFVNWNMMAKNTATGELIGIYNVPLRPGSQTYSYGDPANWVDGYEVTWKSTIPLGPDAAFVRTTLTKGEKVTYLGSISLTSIHSIGATGGRSVVVEPTIHDAVGDMSGKSLAVVKRANGEVVVVRFPLMAI